MMSFSWQPGRASSIWRFKSIIMRLSDVRVSWRVAIKWVLVVPACYASLPVKCKRLLVD